jgi:hypothetical protein
MRRAIRIKTILWKDLRDAIRDARVLVALLVPLGVGIFYNLTFDDEETRPTANVAFVAAEPSDLPGALVAVVGDAVDLQFYQAASRDEVVNELANENADLGLVIPAGFDAAVASGARPALEIIQPPTATFGGDYIASALEPALRLLLGEQPPAQLEVSVAAEPSEEQEAIDKVGLRRWSILVSLIMMIGMIAMLAIPVILAEETEKRTFDALVLISSHVEIIAGKALLGVVYVVVMVPLLLAVTGFRPDRPALFVATVALMTVALLGIGLLMAGFFKSSNQLNTWAGIFLLPVIAPGFLIAVPTTDIVRAIAHAFPTGAGARLLMNSAADERVFSGDLLSFAIIVAWGVVAYALLLMQLRRRQV